MGSRGVLREMGHKSRLTTTVPICAGFTTTVPFSKAIRNGMRELLMSICMSSVASAHSLIKIADGRWFKDEFHQHRELDGSRGVSKSTIVHSSDHCGLCFKWLQRRPDFRMGPDLSGYFKHSRKERAASMVNGTSLTFDQAFCLSVSSGCISSA